MAYLYIDKEKCTGCGLCAKACAVSALTLEDKKSRRRRGMYIMRSLRGQLPFLGNIPPQRGGKNSRA